MVVQCAQSAPGKLGLAARRRLRRRQSALRASKLAITGALSGRGRPHASSARQAGLGQRVGARVPV